MKNTRRYLAMALLCGVGFLLITPAAVRLLQELGYKRGAPFSMVISALPLLFQQNLAVAGLLSLWLLLAVLLLSGLILALISRFVPSAT